MAAQAGLKASTVMQLLIILLVVLFGIMVAGGAYALHVLNQHEKNAVDRQIDADISQNDGSRLQELAQYLSQNAGAISQTAQVASTLDSFTQQDKLIATINDDAFKSNVKITGLTFGANTATIGSTTPSSTVISPLGDPHQINLTIQSPVPYTNFLKFTQLIENGFAPLQIKTAVLDVDTSNNANVNISDMQLQVGAP